METTSTSDSKRYLIIEYEGALEGTDSKQIPEDNDLVISQSKDKFRRLSGGVQIVKYLEVLRSSFGYEIALYSKLSESKLNDFL